MNDQDLCFHKSIWKNKLIRVCKGYSESKKDEKKSAL